MKSTTATPQAVPSQPTFGALGAASTGGLFASGTNEPKFGQGIQSQKNNLFGNLSNSSTTFGSVDAASLAAQQKQNATNPSTTTTTHVFG